MRRVSRLGRRDQRGAVAVLVALLLVVLCLSAAFTIDLGNVDQLRQRANTAVQDAAISGAEMLAQGSSPAAAYAAVQTYVEQNYPSVTASQWNSCASSPPQGFNLLSGENCVSFNSPPTAVDVILPPQLAAYGLARAGNARTGSQLIAATIEAEATANVSGGPSPCGLCLLDRSGRDVDVEGSSYIKVTGGGVTVDSPNNSTSSPQYATYDTGTSHIDASSLNVVAPGCTSSSTCSTPTWFTDNPSAHINAPIDIQGSYSDPLAYLPVPMPSTTTIPSGSFTSNSSGNVTLTAGAYGSVSSGSCSGCEVTIPPGNYSSLSAVGSGTLVLEPGTYFISGSVTVDGAAVLTEQPGVLLYFTCANSSGTALQACASGGQAGGQLNLNASGVIHWSPMTTGTYSYLTVFYDRHNTSQIVSNGYTQLAFGGTLYGAAAQLSVSGSGAALSSLIVVGSVIATGNTPVVVNYVPSQNVQPPGGAYLCSIAAGNC